MTLVSVTVTRGPCPDGSGPEESRTRAHRVQLMGVVSFCALNCVPTGGGQTVVNISLWKSFTKIRLFSLFELELVSLAVVFCCFISR